ncbi:sigma-70 family RNA polymerase sigma factor [Occultella glacieicola]|uniref:Sigma-70 family RNA polymerase sigma factor n=1 Tax=Occultella glacieicola TaxID=2518684 RepID=A0ABY2DYL3_9MICO|nr:sigma-70 family RNA polymerase sigma factor [Occultella glacieicola]TDE89268.1 sigma-70 family RNA polymerase sigma factor [Occultella glacieicola]
MDGDDALTELVRERGTALLRYASLLVGERRGAEDLVQDALVKVFAGSRRNRDVEDVEAYVRRAILTLYLDAYRRHRRWARVRHLFAAPEESLEPDGVVSVRVDVTAALRTLSPRERACVVLRYYVDLTVPQIADELGIAQGTVKRYLSDANTALSAQLGRPHRAAEPGDQDGHRPARHPDGPRPGRRPAEPVPTTAGEATS